MKILQIGAGSMGTRRMRDLHTRPDVTLALFDERPDRRAAAAARFAVSPFSDLNEALAWGPDALIVSTPPRTKGTYLELAFARQLHHFLEADMWTYGAVARAEAQPGVVSAPSATLTLLPLVKQLTTLVRDEIGALLSYQFSLSTYSPSWHPQEGAEYYSRHRQTCPAREMVPFELGWLNAVFGPAISVAGQIGKYGHLPGDTEDTWNLSMRLQPSGTGQLTITMACPHDHRAGCCFGTAGMASWDVSSGEITLQTSRDAKPRILRCGSIGSVIEQIYHEEINLFVDAAMGRGAWPHPHSLSQQCSATLAAAETSSVTRGWVTVDPRVEPAPAPPPLPLASSTFASFPGGKR